MGLIIKNNDQITCIGEEGEKLEVLCIAGGHVKWYSCWGKWYGSFSSIKNRITI